MKNIAEDVLHAIQSVVSTEKDFIPLHEPIFQGKEWNYVKDCLDTGWVSSVGEFVDQFEKMIAEFTGVKRAVAVVNGTAALHIALKLVGVTENDEVLIPTLTFVATANAVTYCNATPHFVDCEEKTLGVDPAKLLAYLNDIAVIKEDSCYNKLTNRRIKALVPMHTFGHPVDIDPLVAICERFKIELVEDIAESLGSYYKGKHTGNFGKTAALSFNGNKIITTGGGGAILTNDEAIADHAKHLTTTAKVPHKWEYVHDFIGYNYRLPNINAALGCAQLEQLSEFLHLKRKLAENYEKAFANVKGVRFFKETNDSKSNYWLNTIILEEHDIELRNSILQLLNEHGYMSRPLWEAMHNLPIYKHCPKMDVSIAEDMKNRVINIPSSANLVMNV